LSCVPGERDETMSYDITPSDPSLISQRHKKARLATTSITTHPFPSFQISPLIAFPQVVITYTSPSSGAKADSLVSTIASLPNTARAITVRADLSSSTSPDEIVSQALSAFGPAIHILVNNAAVQITRPLAEISLSDYDSVYAVNVRGVLLMTQACLPHMPARSRVINISSVGARAGFANLSLYTSSKAAMEGLTRSWAAELGTKGTTVNCVAPGPVKSEMLDSIPTEIVKMQMESTPVEKRVGTMSEVSNVVGWLCGEEASWVSGQVLNVSGGWSMY
jgi:3-oxoacyl-[acyl-carrier protein] reductase